MPHVSRGAGTTAPAGPLAARLKNLLRCAFHASVCREASWGATGGLSRRGAARARTSPGPSIPPKARPSCPSDLWWLRKNELRGSGPSASRSAVVAYVGLVWLALGELGMTWDEPYFFERQHDIRSWFGDLLGGPGDRARAFSRDGLERSWRFAREVPDQHPPVPELLSLATGETLGWLLGPLRSYRLSTVLVFAAAAAVLARLVGSRWGLWAAGAALGALLFNPRPFADAQQITADSDTGAFWFLAAVAFLRSCETGRRLLAVRRVRRPGGDVQGDRRPRRPRDGPLGGHPPAAGLVAADSPGRFRQSRR